MEPSTAQKRPREEEAPLKFDFKEPAEEVGERAIVTNSRVSKPQRKSLAWGALAFAAGVGAMYVINLIVCSLSWLLSLFAQDSATQPARLPAILILLCAAPSDLWNIRIPAWPGSHICCTVCSCSSHLPFFHPFCVLRFRFPAVLLMIASSRHSEIHPSFFLPPTAVRRCITLVIYRYSLRPRLFYAISTYV